MVLGCGEYLLYEKLPDLEIKPSRPNFRLIIEILSKGDVYIYVAYNPIDISINTEVVT